MKKNQPEGAAIVPSSNLPFGKRDWHVGFTTVSYKPLSDQ